MAQPAVTDISPNNGLAIGGQIIELTGSNFKEPAYAAGIPSVDVVPTVSVKIDGVEADAVWVLSSTSVRARVPAASLNPSSDIKQALKVSPDLAKVAFTAVDIAVANLDSAGDPIVGETTVVVGGYTYEQPLMNIPEGDPPLLQVLQEFLRLLKRTIVSRAAWTTHTDFGDFTATAVSSHPSLGFTLSFPKDVEYGYGDCAPQYFEQLDDTSDEYRYHRTVMMVASMVMSSSDPAEALHLANNFIMLPEVHPWLRVTADPNYPGEDPNMDYPLEIVAYPEQIGSVNAQNITAFSATVRVRGIPIMWSDPAVTRIQKRDNLYLIFSDTDGSELTTLEV
jgi:hypothetical protein